MCGRKAVWRVIEIGEMLVVVVARVGGWSSLRLTMLILIWK